MRISNQKCLTCIFYSPFYQTNNKPDPEGKCRRYPPNPTTASTSFPIVNEYDWCGEWYEKSRAEKDAEK